MGDVDLWFASPKHRNRGQWASSLRERRTQHSR